MKIFKTAFALLFLAGLTTGLAQNYRDCVFKINNYVVQTYGHTKELSDDITPYQEALGVEGLLFKQYAPYDPQTDDYENQIKIGSKESGNRFIMHINEGEWVSGFSCYNENFQISLDDRVFKIGDQRDETLAKLDLGYVFRKGNQNVAQVFYGEAFFYIYFKNDKISAFKFDNTSY